MHVDRFYSMDSIIVCVLNGCSATVQQVSKLSAGIYYNIIYIYIYILLKYIEYIYFDTCMSTLM